MPEDGKIFITFANIITAEVCRRWYPWLISLKEEALSQAYVSVVVALRKYPLNPKYRGWSPAAHKKAYGHLVDSLKTQKYLPHHEKLLPRQLTNIKPWQFDGVKEDEGVCFFIAEHDCDVQLKDRFQKNKGKIAKDLAIIKRMRSRDD